MTQDEIRELANEAARNAETIAAVVEELRRDATVVKPRTEDTFPDETSWGPTLAEEIQDRMRR